MPSGSVSLAVTVTGTPAVGEAGWWATWRIWGGAVVAKAWLGAPGLGVATVAPGSMSSASIEKSVLSMRVLRAWMASTLVPPTRNRPGLGMATSSHAASWLTPVAVAASSPGGAWRRATSVPLIQTTAPSST